MAEKPIFKVKLTNDALREILNNPNERQKKLLAKVFAKIDKAKTKAKGKKEEEPPKQPRVYMVSIPVECGLCGDKSPVVVKSNVANPDTIVSVRKFWCEHCEERLEALPSRQVAKKLMEVARLLWPDSMRRD